MPRRRKSSSQVRAIAYTRVSTGKQADSGLGLTDQIETITAAVERKGWTVVHHAEDAGLSGRSVERRPALVEALAMLDRGDADVLVAAKVDRITRSVKDLATLLERAERRGWSLVVLDLDVDTTTPGGEFLAHTIGSAARYESRLIGARVKAAHRVRRAQGKRAGQAPILPAEVRGRIAGALARGATLRQIARELTEAGVATAKSPAGRRSEWFDAPADERGAWYASTVAHVLRSVALDDELAAVRAS